MHDMQHYHHHTFARETISIDEKLTLTKTVMVGLPSHQICSIYEKEILPCFLKAEKPKITIETFFDVNILNNS